MSDSTSNKNSEQRDERRVIWQTCIPSVELSSVDAEVIDSDYGDIFVRFVRRFRGALRLGADIVSALTREGGEQPADTNDYESMSMLEDAEEQALGMLLDEFEAMKRVTDVAEKLASVAHDDEQGWATANGELISAVDELRAHRVRKANDDG